VVNPFTTNDAMTTES